MLSSHAFSADKRVIGFFGFLTSAKRAEVVLEAFRPRARDPSLELLIVGEPAPNIDIASLHGDGITMTGYVGDDDFPRYYAEADRFVNLRYPTAGETSGTLIRALDAGKPVAVSDYAQFSELPDDAVVKIPLGAGEVERLVAFFLDDLPDPRPSQRALARRARVAREDRRGISEGFVVRADIGQPARFTRCGGDSVLPQARARVRTSARHPQRGHDGHPDAHLAGEYRLIVRFVDGDRWVPSAVRPASRGTAEIEVRGEGAFTLHRRPAGHPDARSGAVGGQRCSMTPRWSGCAQSSRHVPRSRSSPQHRRACVLIPLIRNRSEWSILFTRRSQHLAAHSGQIAFPGGAVEAGESFVQAVVREAEEEVGIPPRHVEVIGRLDDLVTHSGFLVAPFVGVIREPVEYVMVSRRSSRSSKSRSRRCSTLAIPRCDPCRSAGRSIRPTSTTTGGTRSGASRDGC